MQPVVLHVFLGSLQKFQQDVRKVMNHEEREEFLKNVVGTESPPLEEGVVPLDPEDPAGLCKTYDGSINIDASRETPRNRAVSNHGKDKTQRLALMMANASIRQLMGHYEEEVTYSRCVFSSEVDTQASLPRTCSRGHFDGNPIASDCRSCKNFTLGPEIIEIEDIWPDSAFTNMLKKKRPRQNPRMKVGQELLKPSPDQRSQTPGCSKCQDKKQPKLPQYTGLGSTLEKFFSLFGVKSCQGCKRRRDKLNRMVRYGKNRYAKSNKHDQ